MIGLIDARFLYQSGLGLIECRIGVASVYPVRFVVKVFGLNILVSRSLLASRKMTDTFHAQRANGWLGIYSNHTGVRMWRYFASSDCEIFGYKTS